jgi:hypothetical protein
MATTSTSGTALRGFRHVFRHAYDYALKWSLMRPNVERLPEAHRKLLVDIEAFLSFLRKLAESPGL